MRLSPLLLLGAALFFAACDQRQPLDSPADTTAIQDTGYERIDIAPNAASAYLVAIGDDGTILGMMADSGQAPEGPVHPFIYRDGTIRALANDSSGDGEARFLNLRGQIAGQAGNRGVLVWDSPDATPRRLDTGLPTDDADDFTIVALSDRGDIVANHVTHAGIATALLWRNGVRQDLGFLADSVLGGTFVRAANDAGQIVGMGQVDLVIHPSDPPTKVVHPILWENGVLRDLGVLAHKPCTEVATPTDCGSGSAYDINAHGVIVGVSTGPDGFGRAFIWENGVMRDLGAYPGQSTFATQINDRGQVLGSVGSSSFFWENGTAQLIMNNLDGGPHALGANGEVVGSMNAGPGNLQHAFVWKDGHLTDLGVGMAYAINSQGDIIGNWWGDQGEPRAILWRKKRQR